MSTHGVLGKTTSYPKTYQPKILCPIPRKTGRQAIAKQYKKKLRANVGIGVDWWHAFEISWLNLKGISQVAIARFSIPADSPNIIESKSLKLYLNSLNFTEFVNKGLVLQILTKDLSECVGAEVKVELLKPDDVSDDSRFLIRQLKGKCIDKALTKTSEKIPLLKKPDASLLAIKTEETSKKSQFGEHHHKLYSNLLRSNCPVTSQPDWGTLAIEMTTEIQVNKANLLQYILSFRQHNGFHEQCVEQIFADLTAYYQPSKLMVRAWYTRRGGLDINPCRVSDMGLLPKPSRLIRQ